MFLEDKPQYFLAPMAGITNLAYRILLKEYGADVLTTELISAKSYSYGSKRTKEMMKTLSQEQPCGIQVFGTDIDEMCAISQYAMDNGASFVDINCGCPVPKVVKSGAGSAMLKEPKKIAPLLESMREQVSIPLSLKIRTGWDHNKITASEVIHIAQESGFNWVSVHGRTKEQGYTGKSDWKFIKELSANTQIPIIGNGDIADVNTANDYLKNKYCHHLMIGRRVLTDPLFFLKLKKIEDPNKNIFTFIERYHDLCCEHTHPKIREIHLKKIIIYLANGWVNYDAFRKRLYLIGNDMEDIKNAALDFFAESSLDPSYTDSFFLKGGHG